MNTVTLMKAAALAALLGGAAQAQTAATTEVQQPGEETAVVPADATKAGAPAGTVTEGEYLGLEQMANDQTVAETLLAQGFSNIHILREGSLMTITALRNGEDIELVYNLVDGRLVKVNGQQIMPPSDAEPHSGEGTGTATPANPAEDSATEGEATESEATEGEEAPASEATEGEATEGETGGGTDGGTDAGGESGSEGGTNG